MGGVPSPCVVVMRLLVACQGSLGIVQVLLVGCQVALPILVPRQLSLQLYSYTHLFQIGYKGSHTVDTAHAPCTQTPMPLTKYEANSTQ